MQKINYLPEQQTDMILAVIGEELGLIGTMAVIGAFAAFAFAGFVVALHCRDPFGKPSPPGSPRSSAVRRRSTSPPCSGSRR